MANSADGRCFYTTTGDCLAAVPTHNPYTLSRQKLSPERVKCNSDSGLLLRTKQSTKAQTKPPPKEASSSHNANTSRRAPIFARLPLQDPPQWTTLRIHNDTRGHLSLRHDFCNSDRRALLLLLLFTETRKNWCPNCGSLLHHSVLRSWSAQWSASGQASQDR